MTPTGHADFGVQNLYLKTNQGPKVLESSLARGPLQCQSEHYNNSHWQQLEAGPEGLFLGRTLKSRSTGMRATQLVLLVVPPK